MKKFGFFIVLFLINFIVIFSVLQTRAEDFNSMGFSPSQLDIEIDSSFDIAVFADIVFEVDTVEVTNFSWTAPGIINYSSCAPGQLFESIFAYMDPDISGKIHNDQGWACPITQSTTQPTNNTNGTLGITSWNAVGTGNVIMQISLGKTIRNGVLLPTDYSNIAEIRIHPKPPELFIASQISPGLVKLNWEKGVGAVNTVVLGSQNGYPTDPSVGVVIYNGSGNICYHNISQNQTWYYTTWSYASELFSISYENAVIQPICYTLTVNINGSGAVDINPLLPTYPINSTISLTATPDPGWEFAYWQHTSQVYENPYIFEITANTTISLVFDQQIFTLNTSINGLGILTLNPPGGTYIRNTSVEIAAVPSPGWSFSHWTGDIVSNSNPESIIMNDNRTVTATFTQNQYTLQVTVSGEGTILRNPDQTTYTHGMVVNLEAFANTNWTFNHWSGNLSGNINPQNITVDCNKTVTAYFTQDSYMLSVNIVGSGNVSLNPFGGTYPTGTVVTLTAVADAEWRFSHWSDDLSGSSNSTTITMNNDKTVTAHFIQNYYTLSINHSGNGTVNVSSPGGIYPSGTTITLTALPDPGWEFDHWSGALTSSQNPTTLIIDSNKTITAHFLEILYNITIDITGNGSVTVDPSSGPYPQNSVINLTAVPDNGWKFRNWSGDISNAYQSFKLTMNQSYTISVLFTIKNYTLDITITGNGTITRTPDNLKYNHNSSVTINASPEFGWEFDQWTGDISDQNPSTSVIMSDNKTIEAIFIKKSTKPSNGGGHSRGSGGIIPNIIPKAIITVYPSADIVIDEEITFDASNSWDPDNNTLDYRWIFSDGTIHNETLFTTRFSESGQYLVKLYVKNMFGLEDNDTIIISVSKPNQPPSKPAINGPSIGKSNTALYFIISSNDSDNDLLQYTITWGDGNSLTSDYLDVAALYTASHQWKKPGIYHMSVSADDNLTTSSNIKDILIDGIYVFDLGYILDLTNNEIHDVFFSNSTKNVTDIGYDDPWYLLDENGNGDWDWRFDPSTMNLKKYNDLNANNPGVSSWMINIIAAIAISFSIFILFKKDII